MGIRYDSVKPWGRNFEEYRRMFALSADDLDRHILGCGDGPASFNAGMKARGKVAVSADPLYGWSASLIAQRLADAFDDILRQTAANRDRFVWHEIGSIEELGARRMAAMQEFLTDYEEGRVEGRYVDASLPALPFARDSFGLALCSHLLFLYTDNLSEEFHRQSITEMLRVAAEARVFPVLDANATRSAYLDGVLAHCAAHGWTARVVRVDYEFQRGGDQMLQIIRC